MMMLESALDNLHIFTGSQPEDLEDDIQPLQKCHDKALSHPLPHLLYSPPSNFGMVTHNLYRSSFPQRENFPFLRKLGLKSVLYSPIIAVSKRRTLVQEEYPTENSTFLESAGIRFFQFPIPANKEPFVVIPDISIIGALETILDKRNHPILVHCNAGKVDNHPPRLNR